MMHTYIATFYDIPLQDNITKIVALNLVFSSLSRERLFGLFLNLKIIKNIQGDIILCITIPLGIVSMCYGMFIGSLLSLVYKPTIPR